MPARHLSAHRLRAGGRITAIVNTRIDGMAFAAGLALAFRVPRASRCRVVLRFSDEEWWVLSVLCRPPTSHPPSVIEGLTTRSRQLRASFCPALRGVPACLPTGGIDCFEDRFDAIAGDYDTATSGDAAGRTKRVGRLLRPVNGSDRLPYRREDSGPLTRAARFARRRLAVPNRAIPAK
jgi:hypothetical protein